MHRAGVIRKPDAIRAWLTRLGLWEGVVAIPPAHAPPFPGKGLWGVDAWDGRIVEFEPGWELDGLPTRRRSKSPRERHLSYNWEDCDQQGREIDQPAESQISRKSPPTRQRDDGLLLVFDTDPAPPDDEPVFWREAGD